jgi:hypothetical protein
VYANLTIALSQVLDARFFRVWGALYAVLTLLLWIVVFSRTVVLVRNGRIFDAPCLQEEADATTMVMASSSSTETTDRDQAGTPMVPVAGDLTRQEKMRASIC